MQNNNLNLLHNLGQSIWLDFIDRSILADGTLAGLIRQDDLAGLTSTRPFLKELWLSDGQLVWAPG